MFTHLANKWRASALKRLPSKILVSKTNSEGESSFKTSVCTCACPLPATEAPLCVHVMTGGGAASGRQWMVMFPPTDADKVLATGILSKDGLNAEMKQLLLRQHYELSFYGLLSI